MMRRWWRLISFFCNERNVFDLAAGLEICKGHLTAIQVMGHQWPKFLGGKNARNAKTVKEQPSHNSSEEFVMLANLHREWDPKYVASMVNKSIKKRGLRNTWSNDRSDEAGQAEFDRIKPLLYCIVRLKYPPLGRISNLRKVYSWGIPLRISWRG